jgi:hypothetical protein
MPGLVKIGCTSQEDVAGRLNQLYSTGVPFPFEVEFAARVPNMEEVERALHQAFGPYRVNPKREFFKIDAFQAIAILKLLHVEDATKQIEQLAISIEPEDSAAAAEYRARRPRLNFVEMRIPIGSELLFTDGAAHVVVTGPRQVSFDGDDTSLSAVTRSLLGLDHNVAPAQYWTFNGRNLRDIYDETYQREA